MRLRMVAATALAAVVSAALPRAEDADPRMVRVEQWVRAVVEHEPGETDAALRSVAAWTSADLSLLWVDLSVLVQLMRQPKLVAFENGPRRGSRGPVHTPNQIRRLRVLACAAGGTLVSPVCLDLMAAAQLDESLRGVAAAAEHARDASEVNFILRRGALLEADAAMLAERAPEPVTAAPRRSVMPQRVTLLTSDGTQLDFGQTPVHWEIGRMLLDDVRKTEHDRPAPSEDDMVRSWYVSTLLWMQSRDYHDDAHLERARALFGSDAELLFLNGTEHETYAAPHIQSAVRSAVIPAGFSFSVDGDRTELKRAEGFFRRSVGADPASGEAHVRLGRVLQLLGRPADAIGELRDGARLATEDILRYYAALFEGAAEATLGRYEESRTAFERAASLFPSAQSPLIGLSELARRQGDREGALKAMQRVFAVTGAGGEPDDPWWTYHTVQGRTADDRLEHLRAPFRAARLQ